MDILARFRRPTAAAIIIQMLEELKELQRSNRYINALRRDLTSFVACRPRISKWTARDIAFYLRNLNVGPRRRDNIRDSIVTLSRFARRHGYLPEERTSASEKVRKIRPGSDIVTTWSASEAELLLEHASIKWLPCIAIGLFAGLRTSEILRLDWSALKWEHNPPLILIHRKIAKKIRRDRHAPLLPNLQTWLLPYRQLVGPLYPGSFKSNENALSQEMNRIRKANGLPRRDNAIRHSFGSYRIPMVKSRAQVADEMGTSERKLRANYNDPKSEDEAARYFTIGRQSRDNVVPMPLALEFR